MKLVSVYFTVIVSTCMDRFHAYQRVHDDAMYDDYNIYDNAMTFDEDAYIRAVQSVRNASTGYPDPINGLLLDNWDPNSGIGANEVGNYYQGDILHIPDTSGRSGIIGNNYRWPNRVVPYKISSPFSAAERARILQAVNEYNTKTCVQLKEALPTDRDYVNIINTRLGCFSSVGKVGGPQTLNLQVPGCVYYVGTIVHELLHSIGFFHEQSRLDRDNYVTINLNNVYPGNESQFAIERNTFHYNLPYDYGSVMHYSGYAFSKNNLPTIVSKKPGVTLGNNVGLTATDIQKIKLMYNC